MKTIAVAAYTIYYLAFFAANTFAVLIDAVSRDGCTKCYVDSDAQRWKIAFSAVVWLAPALLLLSKAVFKMVRSHVSSSRQVLPRAALLISGLLIYASCMTGSIASALRCGYDCFPPHPLSQVYSGVSTALFFVGLFAGLYSFVWLQTQKQQALPSNYVRF
ncbi:hypothetical protein [Ciceribacter lividus]|uniref:hypothetical protein n=1 Tax=Ciceribacter lividus TaxID=1197950 RepID=UPI000DF2F17F|nr:hypothetical protein [Ciceribacter lividus]